MTRWINARIAGYLSRLNHGERQEKAAPESAAQIYPVPLAGNQAESPPAAAGAGVDEESLPEEPPSLDVELSEEDPLPLEDDADSFAGSLLSEPSFGRLGRPVVGCVEPTALVYHRDGVENSLACAATDRACALARLAERLNQFKLI